MAEQPYNPLDKIHLGESVVRALLECPAVALPPAASFVGAGLYALYYAGNFPAYQSIAEQNRENAWARPIYVGKAVPAGSRKGGYGLGASPGDVLYRRLCEHASSNKQPRSKLRGIKRKKHCLGAKQALGNRTLQGIQQATNLALSDFRCRYLVVDDIWIPLGESLLISKFLPLWNHHLDGFGNHDPGSGRYNQRRSPWDEVHPGRPWAARLRANTRSPAEMLERIVAFIQAQ
jgi:hypothetical protein